MSIDLKGNPYYLSNEDINWVETTRENMSLEEKIGQLFCPIVFTSDETELKNLLATKHVGGVLYREGAGSDILVNHKVLQDNTKIPLLLASNLEQGGNGSALEGTYYGKQMEIAATNHKERAYQLGMVACTEGAAVGVNWAFAPVVDIDYNFRNPITNIRTYGDNPKRVLEMAKEYVRAAKVVGVATSVKHFPGDGIDERDQHLLTSVNTLTCEEWDKTYGNIYGELIKDGTLTVMIGHIAMPAYEERISGKPTTKMIPATLSLALLKGLLRDKLGFNGLITSDATSMVGFCTAMARKEAVPSAIAAGCDMFLFNKDLEEDFEFMLKGYENGILTDERIRDAVTRILATKAALKLHDKQKQGTLVPDETALSILGCGEHVKWAKECADEAITLVKDTQNLLPLSIEKHSKILLQILGDFSSNDRVIGQMTELLEKEGFVVTIYVQEDFRMPLDNVAELKRKYDLIFYLGNVDNQSNKTVSRIQWHTFFGLGNNIPWFVEEVPTLFVSVGNPYHLLDVPMVKTYINGYCNSPYVLEAVVDKLMGKSEFKGVSPVDPFCGREDTKL